MAKRLDELAREYTDRALATIAEVMTDPFAEDRDKLRAAETMLDRGHGKATQAIIALPAQAVRQIAASMSRQQLLDIIASTELPRLRSEAEPVIDAEYVAVKDPLLE